MTTPQWSGEMLDRPEMVEAFATQLRRVLASHADYVARIRRDAEAMWDANPPEGYSSFEAWWRARWVKGPLADIQEHLEKAAALTFKLEARYRRGRHEIPAARQAAREREQRPERRPELGGGRGHTYGQGQAAGYAQPAPARQDGTEPVAPAAFMDLVQRRRNAS